MLLVGLEKLPDLLPVALQVLLVQLETPQSPAALQLLRARSRDMVAAATSILRRAAPACPGMAGSRGGGRAAALAACTGEG